MLQPTQMATSIAVPVSEAALPRREATPPPPGHRPSVDRRAPPAASEGYGSTPTGRRGLGLLVPECWIEQTWYHPADDL
ncbi:unnamed protein product [Arctogadus glacialis]